MQFLSQWSGVSKYMVSDPGTFFDHYDETHGVGYPLAFLFFTWIVVTLPLFLIAGVLNVTDPRSVGIAALGVLLFAALMWLGTVLEALIAHAILWLFGARGVATTLEAYAFPSAVRYSLWWIPVIGFVPGFYGLYLQIKGLSRFHGVSAGKAAVAAIVAPLLPFAAVFGLAIVAAFVLGIDGGTTAQPRPAFALPF